MAYITLDELKAQLNIELTFLDDDTYLTALIDVAELAVKEYCNAGLDSYTDSTMPATVKHATLFLASHFYITRTPVSYAQGYDIPNSFHFLLDFYRINSIA